MTLTPAATYGHTTTCADHVRAAMDENLRYDFPAPDAMTPDQWAAFDTELAERTRDALLDCYGCTCGRAS